MYHSSFHSEAWEQGVLRCMRAKKGQTRRRGNRKGKEREEKDSSAMSGNRACFSSACPPHLLGACPCPTVASFSERQRTGTVSDPTMALHQVWEASAPKMHPCPDSWNIQVYKGQKRDSADLIKLSILRWGDYPDRP